jgi:hypothetical protein
MEGFPAPTSKIEDLVICISNIIIRFHLLIFRSHSIDTPDRTEFQTYPVLREDDPCIFMKAFRTTF